MQSGVPSASVSVSATAQAQLFDPGFDSTTGDIMTAGVDSQQANTAARAQITRNGMAALTRNGRVPTLPTAPTGATE